MFLFSLAAYAACLWFLSWFGPWMALALPTVALSQHFTDWRAHFKLAIAAALAWGALAAAEDMANADLVSLRLGNLFALPRAWMIFPLLATLIFLAVFFTARACGGWRKTN